MSLGSSSCDLSLEMDSVSACGEEKVWFVPFWYVPFSSFLPSFFSFHLYFFKMSSVGGLFLVIVGSLLMLHSAYSAAECKDFTHYLRRKK